jgi:hypothetical protein
MVVQIPRRKILGIGCSHVAIPDGVALARNYITRYFVPGDRKQVDAPCAMTGALSTLLTWREYTSHPTKRVHPTLIMLGLNVWLIG